MTSAPPPCSITQTRSLIAVGLVAVVLLTMTTTAVAEPRRIQQKEFLVLVREKHPIFAETRLNVEAETFAREALLGTQDWRLMATAKYDQQREIAPLLLPDQVDQATTGIALERAFWSTGGRLRVGWDMGHARSTFSLPEPFALPTTGQFRNQFSAVYSHPLIKNGRGVLDRTRYEVAEYAVAVATLQAEEDHESFLLDLARRFVVWASQSEQHRIAVDRVQLARQQLAQITRRHQNFLVDKIDVLRAEDAVRAADSRARLLLSQRDAVRAELAVVAQFDGLVQAEPEFDFTKRPSRPALAAIEKVRILRILDLRRDQLERDYVGLLEAKKPELSLQLGMVRKAGGGNAGELLDLNTQGFSVGLAFSLPLGNRTASAKAREGATRLRQLALSKKRTGLVLKASFQNLVVQLAELERVLKNDELQLQSARAKTQEEIKHYNDGRGDLTFVIQAQDAEENAKLVQLQNVTSYHLLYLELQGLLDRFWPIAAQGDVL